MFTVSKRYLSSERRAHQGPQNVAVPVNNANCGVTSCSCGEAYVALSLHVAPPYADPGR
ncbi:hypothetical protein EVJ58_g10505 [Rhodofomes roseus]|uniref:Uncharacterized protein n=1 Tax=Rhodofomes roseus TaxID=34475 RepID=A0A4Y9XQV0_9APHY|nr:hypothetical protein EVJ58_g10505 [Rhodofomes roseus]